jgi:hypothetical protein
MGYSRHDLSPSQIDQGVSGSFGLLAEGSMESRGALEQPHQPSESRGRLGHRCGSVVWFGGSFYPRCVCTFVGSPCLTEEEAWSQFCEAETVWLASDEREARITAAGTIGGVVRS